LSDSRKYPYHTTGDILEFQGRRGFLDWNSEGVGRVTQFQMPWGGGGGGGGGLDFPEGEGGKGFV